MSDPEPHWSQTRSSVPRFLTFVNELGAQSQECQSGTAGAGSHMDRSLADRKRGFLDGFRAGGMRVTSPCQIFCGATKFHQYGRFMDHFAGLAADDMHAKHPIGLRICENLHKSVSGLVDLRTAIRGEWKFSDGIRNASLLELFLGLADRGDFRRGIDDARDHVVVHVAGLAGDDL